MADAYLRIILSAIDRASGVIKHTSSAFGGLKNNLTDVSKLLGAGFGFAAITSGFRKIIKDTNDYAKSVEDLSRSLGASTEETSKLIQMTDDLEISQSALESGMKIALRQGIEPNIAGIKTLAEKYQQLQTPAEKAAFAMETFGRNGLEMQKILEKTPDQIDAMAKALDGSSLIMSQDAVQAAKNYRMSLDNLEDTMMGLKVTVGNELLPTLTEAANKLNEIVTVNMRAEQTEKELKRAVELGIISRKQYKEAMDGVFSAAVFGKISVEDLAEAEAYLQHNVCLVTHETSIGMGNLREYEAGMRGVAEAAEQSATANSKVAIAIVDTTRAAMGKEAIELLTKAYEEGLIVEEDYEGKLRNIMSSYLDLPGDQIVASLALRDIKEDLEDNKTTTMEAYNSVLLLSGSLSALDGTTVHAEVVTNFTTIGKTPSDWTQSAGYTPPILRGSGGPVYAGHPYTVGDRGAETFIPSTTGRVVSNQFTMNVNTNASTSSVRRDFAIMKSLARI